MSSDLFAFPPVAQGSCSYPFLSTHLIFNLVWMTAAWCLNLLLTNGSMIDFAWPSSFFLMAINYYWQTATGSDIPTFRRLAICLPYWLCGARFMFGWTFSRKHYLHEDARWAVWRQRWRNGQGWGGIKSVAINFFFFYQAQGLANAFVFSLPLHFVLCSTSTAAQTSFSSLELFAIALWIGSFILENVADIQLAEWKKKAKRALRQAKENEKQLDDKYVVCKSGLWNYSRHPNYFFELMLWTSYALFATQSISSSWMVIGLGFGPIVAYLFLVEFTGVWMAEQASLAKRGEPYARYIRETNMLIPGPNRTPKRRD